MIKLIRFATLASGVIIILYIMFLNFNKDKLILSESLILLIWIMIPFYLFYFFTRKSEKAIMIIMPALALIFIYIIITQEYLRSDNATAGLVLLIMPVYGTAALGAGLLIKLIIGLFKKS